MGHIIDNIKELATLSDDELRERLLDVKYDNKANLRELIRRLLTEIKVQSDYTDYLKKNLTELTQERDECKNKIKTILNN